MKLAFISNNYGKTYDAIGVFAKVIAENLPDNCTYDVYSADCRDDHSSKIQRMFNMGMTMEIFKASKGVTKRKYNAVLMDYPFMEWNPLILVAFKILSICSKKKSTALILTLHEYERASRLRKIVSEQLCKMADVVMVSSNETGKIIEKFNKNWFSIELPVNISNYSGNYSNIKPNRKQYVYMGLVNKTKAFTEMLAGWDLFNQNDEYCLNIITASELGDIEKEHKGIKYLHMASDEMLMNVMRESVFCILPIIPAVEERNGSYKSACIAGCISIGFFCDKFRDFNFTYHIKDYEAETLANAFKEVQSFSDNYIKNAEESAIKYGENFTPSKVSKKVIEKIEHFMNNIIERR